MSKFLIVFRLLPDYIFSLEYSRKESKTFSSYHKNHRKKAAARRARRSHNSAGETFTYILWGHFEGRLPPRLTLDNGYLATHCRRAPSLRADPDPIKRHRFPPDGLGCPAEEARFCAPLELPRRPTIAGAARLSAHCHRDLDAQGWRGEEFHDAHARALARRARLGHDDG